MHIPDGFLSLPVNAATAAVSLGCCTVAIQRANQTLSERQIPLLGVTGAFVFAAQMINFPVAGGTSGHLMGGLLAAILLGPLNGLLVIAIVLAIQCLVFADGGLTALGSNVFNLGVVGTLLGYLVFKTLRALLPKTRSALLASSAIAAWGSVLLASAACAVELALSGTVPLHVALPGMTLVHATIGIGEGIITAMVLATVLGARPDLLSSRYRLALPSPA